MELWTCYPSKKENFENVDNGISYKAGGDLTYGSSTSSVHSKDIEMTKIYMYLAIAIIVLIIIYLMTAK